MKVFKVEVYSYGGTILGIFSSLEDAKNCMQKFIEKLKTDGEIENGFIHMGILQSMNLTRMKMENLFLM